MTDKEKTESLITEARILELQYNPVDGNFDDAHLREINRRIFQDLPALGFDHVTPGQYRSPVRPGHIWHKVRDLKTFNTQSHVIYSPMDRKTKMDLKRLLQDVKPFIKMNKEEFTEKIATLYTRLDYIHPFTDGNSRTLREFTRQLAQASGYIINWDGLNTPTKREELYIARDIGVNRIALDKIESAETRQILNEMLDLDKFLNSTDIKNLNRLLADITEPVQSNIYILKPDNQETQQQPPNRSRKTRTKQSNKSDV